MCILIHCSIIIFINGNVIPKEYAIRGYQRIGHVVIYSIAKCENILKTEVTTFIAPKVIFTSGKIYEIIPILGKYLR